jgi:hypothetical protein
VVPQRWRGCAARRAAGCGRADACLSSWSYLTGTASTSR